MSCKKVLVCQSQRCLAQGSAEVLAAFLANSADAIASECQGQCNLSVTVRVLPDEVWYCRVKTADVSAIVQSHLQNDQQIDRLLHPRLHASYSVG